MYWLNAEADAPSDVKGVSGRSASYTATLEAIGDGVELGGGSGVLGAQPQVAQFRVDVSESENAYTLRAEIPGVKKDDINISIDGDQVAISAEVKNEKEVKDGERVLRSEDEIRKGVRMARQLIAPELIQIPVQAAEPVGETS